MFIAISMGSLVCAAMLLVVMLLYKPIDLGPRLTDFLFSMVLVCTSLSAVSYVLAIITGRA